MNAEAVPSPIIVKKSSDGYDGQFYYRLAINPFDFEKTAFGVTIDNPAWRTQRIGYPIAAWVVAFGHASLVPSALLIVNLLGIGSIAWFAIRLSRDLQLPSWFPLMVVAWPGFVYTLSRDTTEILAASFMLAALSMYFGGRLYAYFDLLSPLRLPEKRRS